MRYFQIFLIAFLSLFFSTLHAGYIGLKSITIDSSSSDWTNVAGFHPVLLTNSARVIDHQWIWQDGRGDDLGDGDYVYPTNRVFNPDFSDTADIEQVRICWDSNYVYFFLRSWNANTNWDWSGVIIAISTNRNSGSPYIIKGDNISPNNGPCAELRSSVIKADYTVFLAGTWKAWLWNNVTHAKLGDASNGADDGNMDNLPFKDIHWNEFELAIPISIIGSPSNKSWDYIIGWGFHENNYFREVQGYPLITEWYFTGGDDTWWNNLGTDPDVCDLIGASKSQQQSDLNSYIASGTPGDSNSFCNIQYSYVTVGDYNKFFLQPSSVNARGGETVPLTIRGYNTMSTGSFLNTGYTAAVFSNIGRMVGTNFYATNITTATARGFIAFTMPGVSAYTLRVTLTSNITAPATNIVPEEPAPVPFSVEVSPSYMAPADEKLTITVGVSASARVECFIYSLNGTLVRKIEKQLTRSNNSFDWDRKGDSGKKAGSGLYLIKIKTGNNTVTKKVLLAN